MDASCARKFKNFFFTTIILVSVFNAYISRIFLCIFLCLYTCKIYQTAIDLYYELFGVYKTLNNNNFFFGQSPSQNILPTTNTTFYVTTNTNLFMRFWLTKHSVLFKSNKNVLLFFFHLTDIFSTIARLCNIYILPDSCYFYSISLA